MLCIEYESEGFPQPCPVPNGPGTLQLKWDDLLWAALTVGRPNRQYVFRHGASSVYEGIFRLSLVRMALEQYGPVARRLRRTDAAKTLDPTEKGAVNYFLGMTVCKLFAAKLLDTPWLLHLDVFRPQLNPVLTGRSRPDLIGQSQAGLWIAMESKGRLSFPDAPAKSKAKDQANRCISVSGSPVSCHIGSIAYFKNDVLRFFWRDPQPEFDELSPGIRLSPDEKVWHHYYAPVLELVKSPRPNIGSKLAEPTLVPIEQTDVQVGIEPHVFRFLVEGQWNTAKEWCVENARLLHQEGLYPDGIRIVAGESWSKPFEER